MTNAETVCLLWELFHPGRNLKGVYANRSVATKSLFESYPDSIWNSRSTEVDLLVDGKVIKTFAFDTVFVHQVPEKL